MTKATFEQMVLPLPIRLVNRLDQLLGKVGINTLPLSMAKLWAGPGRDTTENSADLRQILQRIATACQQEGQLSLVGKFSVRQDFSRFVNNYYHIQETIQQNPAVSEVAIHRPLFIIGLPRTGTTLLHHLLCLDEKARVPYWGELLWPSAQPPSGDDLRPGKVRRMVRQARWLAPQMDTIHPLDPAGPEECVFLIPSWNFMVRALLPHYTEQLLQSSWLTEYHFYRQQLQLLQWSNQEAHLVLKSPLHLGAIGEILALFPTAHIIQTHRTPTKTIPSWCSLEAVSQQLYSTQIDPHKIGQHWLKTWKEMMKRGLAARAQTTTTRFYDLPFQTLLQEPIQAVRNIYTYFHYDFTPTFEQKMGVWLRDQAAHHGKAHHYSAADFGLTNEQIRDEFDFYIAHFGLSAEI